MSKASTIARTATIRVAVAVLSRGHEQLSDYTPLIQRNRALDVALRHNVGEAATNDNRAQVNGNRSEHAISVEHLIFHEGNVTPEQQIYIRARSRLAPLTFIDVSAEFAPTLPAQQESAWCQPTSKSERFSHGYKCMCRFWLDGFLRYTENWDYLVRLDDDCTVAHLDLPHCIQRMQHDGLTYLTPCRQKDHPDVTVGLEAFLRDFASQENLDHQPSIANCPYTNCAIIDLNHYRQNTRFQRFCQAVHASGCIDINRWGDLPLWGGFLSLESPEQPLNIEDSISYFHGSHRGFVNQSPTVYPQHIEAALDSLRPRPCPSALIRVGGSGDGAYLVPDFIGEMRACFSPGVADRKPFEDELAHAYKIPSFLCDYSTSPERLKTPLIEDLQFFDQKWLEPEGCDNSQSLQQWVDRCASQESHGAWILQMDIEGGEYANLGSASSELLAGFGIIILELHWLNQLPSSPAFFYGSVRPLLQQLSAQFTCVHAHPNNACGTWRSQPGGRSFPDVLEVTLVRHDLLAARPGDALPVQLPHPLDIQNVPTRPPLFLDETWPEISPTAASNAKRISDSLSYTSRKLEQLDRRLTTQTSSLDQLLKLCHGLLTIQEEERPQAPAPKQGHGPIEELCHGRPYTLSSSYGNRPSHGLVRAQHPFFFHTELMAGQWIRIDLGGHCLMEELEISNRSDSCFGRAARLVALPGDLDDPRHLRRSVRVQLSDAFLQGRELRHRQRLPEDFAGTSVVLLSLASEGLHLADIQVRGFRIP